MSHVPRTAPLLLRVQVETDYVQEDCRLGPLVA